MKQATVYLIPIALHDDITALRALPAYIIDAVKNCSIFFVENERTARRFLKKVFREIVIDSYEWHTIGDEQTLIEKMFRNALSNGSTIGIMSEAGCPGIADPGQRLVQIAQQMNARLCPLVGPNSVVLALMASGMNGQCFQFVGYLPVDTHERKKKIGELENDSAKRNCTKIFIETPYRNNQLLNDILLTARPNTYLCIASDLTAVSESVKTKKISEWKKTTPDLHKHPTIFLLYAGL
ncbi:MAG TPA: SAM-dependent methyltransferase [Parafilimonas sp.]|nr:SAM-dependent methyltransferase [Parafilimonas sp.]